MGRALSTLVKRHFLLALVLTFCKGPLQSATLERLSLDEMIAKSTSIVRGKVMQAWAAPAGPAIFTHYTVRVNETLKGSGGDSVELVVPGGEVNGIRQSFSGAPVLTTGDEFVFFLYTGRTGTTMILGLTQGLFALPAKGGSDPTATRAATRELMLDRQTGQPVKDETLTMHLSEIRSRISKVRQAQ